MKPLLLAVALVLGLAAPAAAFRDCADCPEMVVAPAGSFTMGSPPSEADRYDDEGPQHRVTIPRPFAVGKFEVTRGEWSAFVLDTGLVSGDGCWKWDGEKAVQRADRSWRDPGFAQDSRHPVVCVSWEDAKAYVAWLSRRTGKAYRLLSEAEWEYVARGGTTSARFWGERADDGCGHANAYDETAKPTLALPWPHANCRDGYVYTSPAGSYRANAFGLHDTLGNAWEWVEDCWNGSYAGAPSNGSAWTGGDCSRRVLRGGSWDSKPRLIRAALRDRSGIDLRNNYYGFRVARTLD